VPRNGKISTRLLTKTPQRAMRAARPMSSIALDGPGWGPAPLHFSFVRGGDGGAARALSIIALRANSTEDQKVNGAHRASSNERPRRGRRDCRDCPTRDGQIRLQLELEYFADAIRSRTSRTPRRFPGDGGGRHLNAARYFGLGEIAQPFALRNEACRASPRMRPWMDCTRRWAVQSSALDELHRRLGPPRR